MVEICQYCGLPMDDHELREDFIDKIKRREKDPTFKVRVECEGNTCTYTNYTD